MDVFSTNMAFKSVTNLDFSIEISYTDESNVLTLIDKTAEFVFSSISLGFMLSESAPLFQWVSDLVVVEFYRWTALNFGKTFTLFLIDLQFQFFQ
mmetsp:Transcript_26341/g.30181  ORF Transcript_26341/g.30181 Transcript_26341/m.30181 type:complete len:95 (+) Transcript_26341:1563-1847(+)